MDQCCHLEVDEASFAPKMFSGDREGARGRQARGRGCVAGALQQDLPGRRRRHQVSWHKSRTCINQMAVNCTFITEKVQIVANAKKNLQACINKFVSAGSFYKSRLSRSNFKLKNFVLKCENKHENIFSLKKPFLYFQARHEQVVSRERRHRPLDQLDRGRQESGRRQASGRDGVQEVGVSSEINIFEKNVHFVLANHFHFAKKSFDPMIVAA